MSTYSGDKDGTQDISGLVLLTAAEGINTAILGVDCDNRNR